MACYRVNSVYKAVQIVDALAAASPQKLTMPQLEKRLRLRKSTLYVLLSTLTDERLVSFDGVTRQYCLGPKLSDWAGAAGLGDGDLKTLALRSLQELTERTRETSHLAVLDGNQVMFIEKVESPEPLKMSSRVGSRFPLHMPATAKCLVAFQSEEEKTRLMKRMDFKACTRNTLSGPKAYQKALGKAKRNGYAVDNEEIYMGTRCIAAPVFDADQKVIAAIGITAPASRFRRADIPRMARIVKGCAAGLSESLRTHAVRGNIS
jgi:IclR family transcriptional regulator, KDG regulon repressor